MTTHVGFDPSLGGDRRHSAITGAEPQLGGERRQDLPLLDHLSKGLWVSVEELRRLVRQIPAADRAAYCSALLARLDTADPDQRLPEVRPWRGGRDQRVRIINSLSIIGDRRASRAISHLVNDENGEVRHAAISALGRLRDPMAVPRLCGVVASKDHPTADRAIAADALAQIGHADAVPGLVAALRTAPGALVVRRIAAALGAIRHEAGLSPLIEILRESEDEAARTEAVSSIGRLSDIRGVLYLWEALDDPSPVVRHACIRALSTFPFELARAALSYALPDPDTAVREAALAELRRRRT